MGRRRRTRRHHRRRRFSGIRCLQHPPEHRRAPRNNEKLIFGTHAELANRIVSDPTLAGIIGKLRAGSQAPSPVEAIRRETRQLNLPDVRTMPYIRHESELPADRHWTARDDYFSHIFTNGDPKLSPARWKELGYGYDAGFRAHVGKATSTAP